MLPSIFAEPITEYYPTAQSKLHNTVESERAGRERRPWSHPTEPPGM